MQPDFTQRRPSLARKKIRDKKRQFRRAFTIGNVVPSSIQSSSDEDDNHSVATPKRNREAHAQ